MINNFKLSGKTLGKPELLKQFSRLWISPIGTTGRRDTRFLTGAWGLADMYYTKCGVLL